MSRSNSSAKHHDEDPKHAYGWDLKHLPKKLGDYELVPYKHSRERRASGAWLRTPSDIAHKKSRKLR